MYSGLVRLNDWTTLDISEPVTPIIVDKKLEIIPVKNILFLLRVGNLLMTLKVIKKATNIFKKSSFTE